MWGRVLIIGMVSMLLVACGEDETEPVSEQVLQPVTNIHELQIVTGQTVYVPAYSEIFNHDDDRTVQLTVTLAIHNSDLDAPIIIQSVRYYDTEGQLVRNYIEEPVEVSPLATVGFVVDEDDTSGGWGANFVVEWGAEQPVYEPVIEAVMISTHGSIGISMISQGRVISQTN